MFDSLHFSFDNEKSIDYGIYLVHMETGMKETHFLSERELISERISGRDESYIYGYNEQPLRIRLTLSPLDGEWTTEKRRQIARWLGKKKYCNFYSTDDIDKQYFMTYVGSSNLFTDSNNHGYITMEFENISPYAYTSITETIYNFSDIVSPTIFHFSCDSDEIVYPYIELYKVGNGNVKLINLTNSGKVFGFNNLLDNELLKIRTKERHIETSLSNTYRYDDMVGDYFHFVYGVNQIQVEGKCEIKFKYRFALRG